MWKNGGNLSGTKKKASTGAGEKKNWFSTGKMKKLGFPQFATLFPQLSVESQGIKEAGELEAFSLISEGIKTVSCT